MDTRECVTHDMPVMEGSIGGIDAHALAALFWKTPVSHAYIERAQAMPKQGVRSMFTYGVGFGILLGVLAALDIPWTPVGAAAWKRAMAVPAAKDGARARASQLLPTAAEQWRLKGKHGRAEAALIALWASDRPA